MSDRLPEILAHVREHLPDVPPEVWQQIELAIRQDLGADRHYIARQPKRLLLEAMARAKEEQDAAQLSKMLGCSIQHARRMKRLI